MSMWKRRENRERLQDLQVWEGVDEDGEEFMTTVEMTTDPKLRGATERVKKIFREHGLTQLAGD